MTESHDLETIRAGYRLWSQDPAKGAAYWISLLADDVQWRSLADGAPGLEFSRACHNKEDVVRYFTELAASWELVHFTVGEFICQGDRIVMLGSCAWTYKSTGKTVETPKADFLRMRDGKLVELVEFYDTAKALAATRDG